MADGPLLTIGEVAERAGVRTSHIRFYERVGVLPEPERVSGQRRYGDDVLHRLSIIDVAQRAGLSLDEIAPLTGPENRSADASRHIRALATDKLPQIDALMPALARCGTGSTWRSTATARASTSAASSWTRAAPPGRRGGPRRAPGSPPGLT
jgi:MerR family redox-sensitive transcriptional activator SoxR